MIVTYAEIDGFKNLKGVSFAPDPKYNIIVGANAQGKTNLLEAMWILSTMGESSQKVTVRSQKVTF